MNEREQAFEPEVELPKGQISLRNGFKQGRLSFVRCDVGLPQYTGEFGLRYRPLLRLARIAGFRSVRIVSNNSQSSETEFGLQGGIGGDGTMRGSLSTATTIVPESDSDLLYDDSIEDTYVPRGRMWGDLTITLNTKEIQKRIMESGKGANDTKAWAKHLNKAIAKEMFEKGAKHLLRAGDIRNDRDAIFFGPVTAELYHLLSGFLEYGNPLAARPEGIDTFILSSLWNLIWFSYIFKMNFRRGNGPARFSLLGVYGPAIDRTAALFAGCEVLAIQPTIKPLKQVES